MFGATSQGATASRPLLLHVLLAVTVVLLYWCDDAEQAHTRQEALACKSLRFTFALTGKVKTRCFFLFLLLRFFFFFLLGGTLRHGVFTFIMTFRVHHYGV